MPEADIGGTDGIGAPRTGTGAPRTGTGAPTAGTGAPTTETGAFNGEIPTGLFGNEGGAGFGGGPLTVGAKLLPKQSQEITLFFF